MDQLRRSAGPPGWKGLGEYLETARQLLTHMHVKVPSRIHNVAINQQEDCTLILFELPRQIRLCPMRQLRVVFRNVATRDLRCQAVCMQAMDVGSRFQDFSFRGGSYCRNERSVAV